MVNLWSERHGMGVVGQRIVLEALTNAGCDVKHDDRDSRCDLNAVVNGLWWLIEVKNEIAQTDTGNLCIETRQTEKRKPSGISISEATVWIHVLADAFVLFRAQPMRLFLKRESGKYEERRFGDVDNCNRGYIIPVSHILAESWAGKVRRDEITKSRVWEWSATPRRNGEVSELYPQEDLGGELFS